jgi:hypothetical protein
VTLRRRHVTAAGIQPHEEDYQGIGIGVDRRRADVVSGWRCAGTCATRRTQDAGHDQDETRVSKKSKDCSKEASLKEKAPHSSQETADETANETGNDRHAGNEYAWASNGAVTEVTSVTCTRAHEYAREDHARARDAGVTCTPSLTRHA